MKIPWPIAIIVIDREAGTPTFMISHKINLEGEKYFKNCLLDYNEANNVSGWQWVAGSGADAAPYFRIFNPYEQQKKFDKNREYVNKWIPELNESNYPEEIVNHKYARERCLSTYKEALQ